MLNFNHLYYFHVTAEAGSVKAAAERLGITQPTVSEQLRSLERSFGVQLFDRSGGTLRLTQAGRDAFEHTTQMFLASERLMQALGKQPDAQLTLRVGVSAAISRTMAADFLLPVLSLDDCRPEIHSADFTQLLRDLRARQLDLVLGENETNEAGGGLESVLISRATLFAVASPNLEPTADWENLALLDYPASSAFHWEVDAHLRDHGLHPQSAGEVDDAFLMLEAVARGEFVAFVPRNVAREALAAGRVRQLATVACQRAGVYAIHPSEEVSRLARLAVERLLAAANAVAD